MSEKNQRDSFIFYRSFYESIKDLDKNQKAEVLEAICSYALDEYTEPLSGVSKGFFTLIKPQLDANRKRFENGSKPKQSISKTKAENKQSISKIEANKNVNDNVNNNNNDNDNDYKKNNIKKENVFVEPATEYYSTTDFTENQQSTQIILDTNTTEVVVERNKQYSQNDLIIDEHMVLDCFVEAGISVFNDGQFGFGSQLVKDISLAELYDKTAIMQWGKTKIFNQSDTLTRCQVNNATYKQLYNVIYQTFQKGYKNLNYINSYLDKELKKINQLTINKNDNTKISGSNQQEQFESEPMFCPSGRGITVSAEESKKRLIEEGRRAKEERDRAEQNT